MSHSSNGSGPPRLPNRRERRAGKGFQVIEGDKPKDAPAYDLSTPAGLFAHALTTFLAGYRRQHPAIQPMEIAAACLQIAASLTIGLPESTAEEFGKAAEHFFVSELEAAAKGPGG